METVNVHEAKTHLSRLLAQVEAGEEVIIARNGKPVARLAAIQKRGKPQFGSWKGRIFSCRFRLGGRSKTKRTTYW